jgi:hypothetical protein
MEAAIYVVTCVIAMQLWGLHDKISRIIELLGKAELKTTEEK